VKDIAKIIECESVAAEKESIGGGKMLIASKPQDNKTLLTEDDNILEKLVINAREDNEDGMHLLCDKIARTVLFRTTRFIGGSNDAEDVSQEVLIKVCEKIDELRDPKAFKGWLNKIIINEVRRHAKKGWRDEAVISIDDIGIIRETDQAALPHAAFEQEELRSQIIGCIDRLPYRQRQAVMMHYFEGLNVTETAEAMGLTQPIVSKYLAFARSNIKYDIENNPGITI
jgi:RNA polymerase sigma-70 factor (ECF subfamily)